MVWIERITFRIGGVTLYQAVGLLTKKVYATGTKPECFRVLNDTYPYFPKDESNRNGHATITRVHPEEMTVVKK